MNEQALIKLAFHPSRKVANWALAELEPLSLVVWIKQVLVGPLGPNTHTALAKASRHPSAEYFPALVKLYKHPDPKISLAAGLALLKNPQKMAHNLIEEEMWGWLNTFPPLDEAGQDLLWALWEVDEARTFAEMEAKYLLSPTYLNLLPTIFWQEFFRRVSTSKEAQVCYDWMAEMQKQGLSPGPFFAQAFWSSYELKPCLVWLQQLANRMEPPYFNLTEFAALFLPDPSSLNTDQRALVKLWPELKNLLKPQPQLGRPTRLVIAQWVEHCLPSLPKEKKILAKLGALWLQTQKEALEPPVLAWALAVLAEGALQTWLANPFEYANRISSFFQSIWVADHQLNNILQTLLGPEPLNHECRPQKILVKKSATPHSLLWLICTEPHHLEKEWYDFPSIFPNPGAYPRLARIVAAAYAANLPYLINQGWEADIVYAFKLVPYGLNWQPIIAQNFMYLAEHHRQALMDWLLPRPEAAWAALVLRYLPKEWPPVKHWLELVAAVHPSLELPITEETTLKDGADGVFYAELSCPVCGHKQYCELSLVYIDLRPILAHHRLGARHLWLPEKVRCYKCQTSFAADLAKTDQKRLEDQAYDLLADTSANPGPLWQRWLNQDWGPAPYYLQSALEPRTATGIHLVPFPIWQGEPLNPEMWVTAFGQKLGTGDAGQGLLPLWVDYYKLLSDFHWTEHEAWLPPTTPQPQSSADLYLLYFQSVHFWQKHNFFQAKAFLNQAKRFIIASKMLLGKDAQAYLNDLKLAEEALMSPAFLERYF